MQNWSNHYITILPMCTNWEIYTPYVGPDGMFKHRNGKFTILKLKSSLLPYTSVEYFPLTIPIFISKYDSVVDDSVVFLSLSSCGYYVHNGWMEHAVIQHQQIINISHGGTKFLSQHQITFNQICHVIILVIKEKKISNQRRTVCSHRNHTVQGRIQRGGLGGPFLEQNHHGSAPW